MLPPSTAQQAARQIESIIQRVSEIILGKEDVVRLAVTCLLARGHLLFEDQPGVGKTMLSQSLAQALGLGFRRVQFTSDLLPADILGASIYDRDTAAFHFHRGPVFTQVLLADEINRATPKTQSALLEAMEEGKVTADGATHALPEPFFVIATQNPSTQIGTFMLPESQMDRFLMRLALGVPDRNAERALLEGQERREMLRGMQAAMSLLELQQLQTWTRAVHASPALLDYLQDLLASSRVQGHGLSPRAGLALLAASRAWALLRGRAMVLPEDIQAVAVPVMGHRLEHAMDGVTGVEFARQLIAETPLP
ncbi:MAG: AAA family ATPase [Prosthecobacter sp.]|uniref:AAA family ATPase n=1 Tax=Prosthecobacter sp. TaxID=1965333 RepID=UPI0019F9AB10|nr:AAA family ATPase [Prosthecobacter sp.]MBE2286917.1 AAA family ATPase [Prosthecobacter sp.]